MTIEPATPAIEPRRSQPLAVAGWLAASGLAAVALARAAVWIAPHYAPLVVFPLLLGTALGAIVAGIAQSLAVGSLKWALVVAVFVAAGFIAAEHWIAYADYRQQRVAAEEANPQFALAHAMLPDLQPPDFFTYMRQESRSLFWFWILDAAAVLVGALIGAGLCFPRRARVS